MNLTSDYTIFGPAGQYFSGAKRECLDFMKGHPSRKELVLHRYDEAGWPHVVKFKKKKPAPEPLRYSPNRDALDEAYKLGVWSYRNYQTYDYDDKELQNAYDRGFGDAEEEEFEEYGPR